MIRCQQIFCYHQQIILLHQFNKELKLIYELFVNDSKKIVDKGKANKILKKEMIIHFACFYYFRDYSK